MFKKIKRFLLKLVYGISYGMKSAENEMLMSKNSSMTDSQYNQQIKDVNVGKDLLKGEVTQEVKDLRYSTYEVYRQSNSYEYIGDGVAVKKEEVERDINHIRFTQRNKVFCKGVLESLNGVNELDGFTLNILYNDVSRFKLERYVESFNVEIDYDVAKISLRFNKSYDLSTPITRMFYNELMLLEKGELKDSVIYENLNSICFTTFKAQGEDDLVMYIFKDLKPCNVSVFDSYITVTYMTKEFNREDLTEKYVSQEQIDKYERKENKNQVFTISSVEKEYKCSECGKNMNKYDYEITLHDFGKPLCVKCLEKYLTFEW